MINPKKVAQILSESVPGYSEPSTEDDSIYHYWRCPACDVTRSVHSHTRTLEKIRVKCPSCKRTYSLHQPKEEDVHNLNDFLKHQLSDILDQKSGADPSNYHPQPYPDPAHDPPK